MTTTLDAPARRPSPPPAAGRHLHWAVPVALFTAALGLYAVAAASWPTEWDSVSLVFGVDRFDVTQASPHAPGYWLYVACGRLIRAVTPWGAADSLLAASALAAAATVAMAWVLGRRIGGTWLAATASAVMLTSPFLAFYGASVGTYPFDALAGLVLLWLAFGARPGSWHAPAAAAALGLAGGTRQSSLLLLSPVAVVAVVRAVRRAPAPARTLAATAVAGALGVAVWLVPMALEQPGGLAAVQEESARMWRQAVEVSSALYGAPGDGVRYNVGQATGYTLAAVGLLLPVTMAAIALRRRAERWGGADANRLSAARPRPGLSPPVVLALAAVPPFAFVTLFHFGKAGYVLSYLPALVLLMLWPATALARRPRAVLGAVVALACVVQGLRFAAAPGLLPEDLVSRHDVWFTRSRFGAPYRQTAAALRDTDRDVERHLALGRAFDPGSHELVYVYFNGGHRFRHAMLTLPEFRAHYIQTGFHEWSAHGRLWVHERDHVLELRPGASAVLVVDEPRAEVLELVAKGRARPVRLPTGLSVFVVEPGVTVYDVALTSGPPPAGHR